MKLTKNDRLSLSQTPGSVETTVVNGEDTRQSVYYRPAGLISRVRKVDRMLADIHAQIQTLRWESAHLRLVREELAGIEATWNGSALCNPSLR